MSCCHYYEFAQGHEAAFTVDASRITFGSACIAELGARARTYTAKRVAVFTDAGVAGTAFYATALQSLKAAGLDVVEYPHVAIEPTDSSFNDARYFAEETQPDVFVSIGGGSVMDTCKAANLYSTWPAALLDYVNAPVGSALPVPGPLKPHIACPTTCGTGSECTGIAVFDYVAMGAKTGIAARELRPSEALIDPDALHTLPRNVLAASAFDVLSHAAESYTAVPFSLRPAPAGAARPMSQGANPWSDMGCEQALKLFGRYFSRALADRTDLEARRQLMWAATLAGIAFGNAGVHLPHGMSYAVAGLVRSYQAQDYPRDHPMVPHGISVIVNAPAVFLSTASAAPQRHLDIARWLGADLGDAGHADAGEVLSVRLLQLMREADLPMGLAPLGYAPADVERLIDSAWPQQRLLKNAPVAVSREYLGALFGAAMSYG